MPINPHTHARAEEEQREGVAPGSAPVEGGFIGPAPSASAADDAEAENKLDQQFAAAHCGGPPEPADGGASSHAQVSISTGILGSHQAGRGEE